MSSTRVRVLCVDADPEAAATMADRLTVAGPAIAVDHATTAATALDAKGADVIVIGGTVEGMALASLLDSLSVPAVCCPANGDEALASRVLDHGATDYVPRRGEWDVELARRVRRAATGGVRATHRSSMVDHERKIRHLQESATEMAGCTEEMAVYRRVIDAAAKVLAFDRSYVGIEIDGWIVPIARSATAAADGARTMSVEEGLVGDTYRSRESRLVEDVERAAGVSPARPEYRSGISVPIGTIGVFQAVACERGVFDRTDLELAEVLCAHAAVVLMRIDSEREVRHERDRFAALFENVPDPVIHYRYAEGEPIIGSVNPAFESLFGYDAGTAIGRSLDALIVPDGETTRAARLNSRVADGERLDTEVERDTIEGLRTFLLRNVPLSAGETRAGYAIYTDITEQKHHQETLAALQRTTRHLICAETEAAIGDRLVETAQRALSLPYAAVLRHLPDERVLRPIAVSETWGSLDTDIAEYLTFEAGDSLTWQTFAAGEDRVYGDITTEPGVGRDEPKVRGVMILAIGEYGAFLIGSPEADAFDEMDLDFARVLATGAEAAFDRTARETTLREREAELADQNRRLERFASVVSHDLRNPLTIARGRLDLAREGEPDQLRAVDDALARIETIIEDVLRLARDDGTIERESVDLAACVREAWACVETDGARLSIGDCGTVHADRSRLQQVFENLFRNCVEHGSTRGRNPSDSGDSVELGSTGNRNAKRSDDSVEHDTTDYHSGVAVRVDSFPAGFFVADDGPGISPEDREAVFDYGYSAGGGSGLGLAIVQRIVEAHDWTVSVTGSRSDGARFEIRTE